MRDDNGMSKVIVDGWTLGDLYRMMHNGVAEANCAHCGYWAEVDPDASYGCPACGDGMLISPLVAGGFV